MTNRQKQTIELTDWTPNPTALSYAIRVMGGNKRVLTIEDATRVVHTPIDEEAKKLFNRVPFSEAELITAKKWGMILVAIPSMVSVQDMLTSVGPGWLRVPDGLMAGSLGLSRTRVGGYMLLYPEYFGTKNRTFTEQVKMVPRSLQSPLAAELIYAELALATKYGKKLSRKQLRCFDEPHTGRHITVGIEPGSFVVKVDEVGDEQKSPFLALAGCYFRPLPS